MTGEEKEMWNELNKLLDLMTTRIQSLTLGMFIAMISICILAVTK